MDYGIQEWGENSLISYLLNLIFNLVGLYYMHTSRLQKGYAIFAERTKELDIV